MALNMTPVVRRGHRIGVAQPGYYREVLNSDSEYYGGSNVGNGSGVMAEEVTAQGRSHSMAIDLPPLAAVVFKPEG